MMARLLTLPAGRTAKWIVLFVVVVIYAGLASQAGKLEGAQKNESSSGSPPTPSRSRRSMPSSSSRAASSRPR